MAEETQKAAATETEGEVAVVADVPEAEKVETMAVCEKEAATAQPLNPPDVEEEKEKVVETNVVGELPHPQKKALDELKHLLQEALNNHHFTPPPPVKEEEKPTTAIEEEAKPCVDDVPPQSTPPLPPVKEVVDEDGAKKIEAIKETIVAVTATTTPATAKATEEEVSIWGIPLLADNRTDVVLLKFLRARDFKVKDAFTMLQNVVAWRKEFGIESLLQEDLGTDKNKVVYMHGVDKQGHPVCYNTFGEYPDENKRTKFLRWRLQFLEKSIRKQLDFSPHGICTMVQVNDLKNSPGPFKRELRQATNQAFQLLQDNYPEFVAKQVFINVPWWYQAFYKMINPFFTQRTKSKFVFASPSKTPETLFKYIAPEVVPVQYGGLSCREGEEDFTTSDCVTVDIIKPAATKHTIEFPAPEACTLVWEARVVGSEVVWYGAEFVPIAKDGYTIIVQKSRKIAASSDEPVISGSFKCGEPGKVVLTFNNQTSNKKKVLLLYRSKTKVNL